MSGIDPGILCFQHCNSRCKVFCLELPDHCPLCSASLSSVELKIPPFCVPYPFTSAKRTQCSLVIRPTDGDFLHHYQNAADLHIGLTDSKGNVYEFDKNGLQMTAARSSSTSSTSTVSSSSALWNQCLSVPIVTNMDNLWKEYWDYIIHITAQLDRWLPNQYSEHQNNCYSFVITFLRMLDVKDLKPSLNSKTQFCKDFIVPRTKNAAKYIALYRRVVKEGISVLNTIQQ
ncbi:MKRN2 opposite strand protein-like [Oppia nitens]|uniref:MKRN2 opposite strand protein-like n=1 Tax=Oppia nitens TaxID=1686743 RepID=UPI0023DAA6CB|nr:MKRN2 opposite strand protein-like [Oppia nitens]